MARTYCPNCDAEIIQANPQMGATVTCRECDIALETISVSPFEVDFPLDYYDDEWEDEWEEEEEEEEN